MKIPSITAYQDRAAVNLMDQGRVSILYFWSTYSPPSLGDFELLQALGEYFGEDKLFIGLVNLNETHWLVEAEPAVQSLNLPVFLYPQSTNLTAFTTGSVPAAYILDQQGRLVASIHGNAPWNHPDVKRSLDELIAQG